MLFAWINLNMNDLNNKGCMFVCHTDFSVLRSSKRVHISSDNSNTCKESMSNLVLSSPTRLPNVNGEIEIVIYAILCLLSAIFGSCLFHMLTALEGLDVDVTSAFSILHKNTLGWSVLVYSKKIKWQSLIFGSLVLHSSATIVISRLFLFSLTRYCKVKHYLRYF